MCILVHGRWLPDRERCIPSHQQTYVGAVSAAAHNDNAAVARVNNMMSYWKWN
jgi:hypothetical protein